MLAAEGLHRHGTGEPKRRPHLHHMDVEMSQRDYENRLVLALVQAMIGAISQNFRRVSLEVMDDGVRLEFVLNQESEEDREEISDIGFEFEALQSTSIDVTIDVLVTTEELWKVPLSGRVVFGRRER